MAKPINIVGDAEMWPDNDDEDFLAAAEQPLPLTIPPCDALNYMADMLDEMQKMAFGADEAAIGAQLEGVKRQVRVALKRRIASLL